MAPELSIINPLNYPSWDRLVSSHQGYSFFHTSYWARVLSDTYGYRPLYFSLIDGNQLKALIPVMDINSFITGRRGISLPFSDYCRPIVADNGQFDELIGHILNYGRQAGWKYFEMRGGEEFGSELVPHSSYYGHLLDISRTAEDVLAEFRSDIRRSIKGGERSGVKITMNTTLAYLDEFFRLNCLTRKRHGLPPQPYRFFRKIFEHVLSRDQGVVVLGSQDNAVVAGAVFFHFGKRAVYKYGASAKNVAQPAMNKLVMWEAIKYYCQNGYECLCFGRTEPENDGLRYYKAGWGSREQDIHYYRFDVATGKPLVPGARLSGMARKLYRGVPLPLSRAIGSVLYRHIA